MDFQNSCRMKPTDFKYLLNLVAPQIVGVYKSINCNDLIIPFHCTTKEKLRARCVECIECTKEPVSEVWNPKLSNIFFYNRSCFCGDMSLTVNSCPHSHWRQANILWRSLNLPTYKGTLPNANKGIRHRSLVMLKSEKFFYR